VASYENLSVQMVFDIAPPVTPYVRDQIVRDLGSIFMTHKDSFVVGIRKARCSGTALTLCHTVSMCRRRSRSIRR
jgi:hypothetical protein